MTALAVYTTDAAVLRRVQTLLWLASGHEVEDIAQRLCVCWRTIYDWGEQYESREVDEIIGRLSALPRSGRPRTALGIIDPLIDKVIDRDPRELGYRSTVWTAARLRQPLSEAHQLSVSQRRVSDVLSRPGIRWKRLRPSVGMARSPLATSHRGLKRGLFTR